MPMYKSSSLYKFTVSSSDIPVAYLKVLLKGKL